jgi:hypothetical protein
LKQDDRADEKRKEIVEIVKNVIINNVNHDVQENAHFNIQEISSRITDSFVQITPPEYEVSFELVTLRSGGVGGGSRTKPGNIFLNWRKLPVVSSDIILIASSLNSHWLVPFAALVVWDRIWSLASIEITERDAVVIWNMWKNKDIDDYIKAEDVLKLVNKELSSYGRSEMMQQELEMILNNLESMKCIEKVEENKWWLREWVRIAYK